MWLELKSRDSETRVGVCGVSKAYAHLMSVLEVSVASAPWPQPRGLALSQEGP